MISALESNHDGGADEQCPSSLQVTARGINRLYSAATSPADAGAGGF